MDVLNQQLMLEVHELISAVMRGPDDGHRKQIMKIVDRIKREVLHLIAKENECRIRQNVYAEINEKLLEQLRIGRGEC